MSEQSTPVLAAQQDEEWRLVADCNSLYDVSNLGRVRSKHRFGRPAPGGFPRLTLTRKGYRRVRLSTGGTSRSVMVHRLVLEAFIGPQPTPRHECNHKDGNKQNNRADNLEWALPVENNAHARAMGLWHPNLGEKHGRARLTREDVLRIRSLEGVIGPASLGREYGVSGTAISLIWKRINWKHLPEQP